MTELDQIKLRNEVIEEIRKIFKCGYARAAHIYYILNNIRKK